MLKYYGSVQAEDIQSFAGFQHKKLDDVYTYWYRQLNGDDGYGVPDPRRTIEPTNGILETQQSAIAKAEEYLESW